MHAILFAALLIFLQQPGSPVAIVPSQPMLVVTGNARILAVPDEATVRLGIVRQAASAQAAQEQANAAGQEILGPRQNLWVKRPG